MKKRDVNVSEKHYIIIMINYINLIIIVFIYFQRATETLLCGKSALVCGYGEVGKGVVSALKSLGCILFVSEADPICALQVG